MIVFATTGTQVGWPLSARTPSTARIAELLERRHRPRTSYDGKVERESYMERTDGLRISLHVGYGEGPAFQDQGTRT